MLIIRWVIVVVLLFGTCSTASGHIALDVSTTCTTTEAGVRLNVTLSNQGDEAALDFNITARCNGVETSLDIPGPLNPGQAATYQIYLSPVPSEPGIYAVVVNVKYHDQTGYPFTTVDATTFVHGQAAMAAVFPQVPPLILKDTAVLKVGLNNVDAASHRVRVWLDVPETLGSLDGAREIILEPGGQGEVSFRLKNRFAGLNSRQPVVVGAEYDEGGLKRTAVIKSYVTIAKPDKYYKRYTGVFWGAAGLALALVLAIQVFRGPNRPGLDEQ